MAKVVKESSASRIANIIIEQLDKGVCPWKKEWTNNGFGSLPRGANGRPYRGINLFLLNFLPYANKTFLTFNKCKNLGGAVKKGEKGYPIFYWNFVHKTDEETGKELTIPFLKSYTVFNVEQCENLPPHFYMAKEDVSTTHTEPIAEAEAIVEGYVGKPSIHYGSNEAYYVPSTDDIYTPSIEQFPKKEAFYATLFHEMGHSTGHSSRLNREIKNGFGSVKYSKEELVAELTSQILCFHCGIDNTIENAAAYCSGWAKHLKGEKATFIVQAASAAQKAADHILGVKFGGEGDED